MENTKIQLTYVGRVETTKNKIGYKYLDSKGDFRVYRKKLRGIEIVGSIVECYEHDDETISGPYTLVGIHANANEITNWENQDRLNFLAFNAEKAILKTNGTKYDQDVKDLRSMYASLSYSQRSLFIIKLIQDIK